MTEFLPELTDGEIAAAREQLRRAIARDRLLTPASDTDLLVSAESLRAALAHARRPARGGLILTPWER